MPGLDPARVVFVDETWAKSNMAATHGYAPRGERLVDAVPFGHWQTTTFVGAMRADGFIAPLTIDGAVNGDLFRAYVERVLVPELRPGDTVVMDNLGSHKVAGVRAAVEAAGCRLLYLPPYSPDLHPIGMAFSKLKGLLRQAAERTVDGLWAGIGRWIDQFSPAECRNYIRQPDTPLHRLKFALGGGYLAQYDRLRSGSMLTRNGGLPPTLTLPHKGGGDRRSTPPSAQSLPGSRAAAANAFGTTALAAAMIRSSASGASGPGRS